MFTKLVFILVLAWALTAFQVHNAKKNFINARGDGSSIEYPIRVGYIDHSHYWYGDNIAADWGVPGYAQNPH